MKLEWEPAIYEHKAALIGRPPVDVANSAKLLTEAVRKEYEIYLADYITVGLDVYNIEAEVLGAEDLPVSPFRTDDWPCFTEKQNSEKVRI